MVAGAIVGDAIAADAIVADAMVADAIVGDASQGTVVGWALQNGPFCSPRIKVVPIEAR